MLASGLEAAGLGRRGWPAPSPPALLPGCGQAGAWRFQQSAPPSALVAPPQAPCQPGRLSRSLASFPLPARSAVPAPQRRAAPDPSLSPATASASGRSVASLGQRNWPASCFHDAPGSSTARRHLQRPRCTSRIFRFACFSSRDGSVGLARSERPKRSRHPPKKRFPEGRRDQMMEVKNHDNEIQRLAEL